MPLHALTNGLTTKVVSSTHTLALHDEEQLVDMGAENAEGHENQTYAEEDEEEEDMTQWQPRKTLPDAYLPTYQNSRPPVVQYGLPVPTRTLEAYAEKLEAAGSFPPLNNSRRASPDFLAAHIGIYLRKQHGIRTGYAHANRLPEGTDILVQLCSNYSLRERGGVQRAEEAAELVKRELGLDPELRARWYGDRYWDSPRDYDDIAVWKRSFAWCS
ncbi:hypothetical protein EIP91_000855 [Steccherinum ochraceum]|uniref:Uncharacterized protein n=1 Tax=Steccherinum ochraceum TaxID=92696 RepID=A0A4R0RXV5_9APHY|nr:hypothetical protein EIP91_000855 [Steccherinum ochraceum]